MIEQVGVIDTFYHHNYSPDQNPIEETFSKVKSELKRGENNGHNIIYIIMGSR